ncbi:MAG: hypothetical protein ACKPAF_08065, partial [Actinomycetota bacterium]
EKSAKVPGYNAAGGQNIDSGPCMGARLPQGGFGLETETSISRVGLREFREIYKGDFVTRKRQQFGDVMNFENYFFTPVDFMDEQEFHLIGHSYQTRWLT